LQGVRKIDRSGASLSNNDGFTNVRVNLAKIARVEIE
jgi:hypothetical protein